MEQVGSEKISLQLGKEKESIMTFGKQLWSKPKASVTCSSGKRLRAQTLEEPETLRLEPMAKYNK